MNTREWDCTRCSATVSTRGGRDTRCGKCGADYNGFGQRLRDDWRENPAWHDDNVDDMEGFEISQLRHELD